MTTSRLFPHQKCPSTHPHTHTHTHTHARTHGRTHTHAHTHTHTHTHRQTARGTGDTYMKPYFFFFLHSFCVCAAMTSRSFEYSRMTGKVFFFIEIKEGTLVPPSSAENQPIASVLGSSCSQPHSPSGECPLFSPAAPPYFTENFFSRSLRYTFDRPETWRAQISANTASNRFKFSIF